MDLEDGKERVDYDNLDFVVKYLGVNSEASNVDFSSC